MKSTEHVLEEVEVLIDTHFFDQFSKTKSSLFLKKVVSNQGVIDTRLFKKTGRTLKCTPKTLKVIREIQGEHPLCVEEEANDDKESRDEVLVQQVLSPIQCQTYHRLLQKGKR